MSKQSLASKSGRIWLSVLLLISACYSLKCRTDDGPSESELKRITRNCMRKIGENMRPSNGGSIGSSRSSSSHSNHYGPLHQSSFGAQYDTNSRYDYNYDYDDDSDRYNDNNNYKNNNNNNNNNNYNYNNGNRDRGDNWNVLQQRNQDRQQNNRDSNRSMSSGSSSSSANGYNNGGRHDYGNNSGGGGGSGNGGGSNNAGRNSGNGNSGNNQRNHSQNNLNNNKNNNNINSKNSSNDTVDPACIVHCFFEEMNMLNSDDYPDRYKVQYGLTRELRDRELHNFYTETIQDCFHYTESQRRRDKCHYSRDLINCMTEYAKVNCDDWQEFNMVFN